MQQRLLSDLHNLSREPTSDRFSRSGSFCTSGLCSKTRYLGVTSLRFCVRPHNIFIRSGIRDAAGDTRSQVPQLASQTTRSEQPLRPTEMSDPALANVTKGCHPIRTISRRG